MLFLVIADVLAALAGLVVAAIVLLSNRFGRGSASLGGFLIAGACSSAALAAGAWLPNESVFAAFACLLVCAGFGCVSSNTIGREAQPAGNRILGLVLAIAGPVIAVLVGLAWISSGRPAGIHGHPFLGFTGYYAALYLLLLSVVALAQIEQTLRVAQEHVRWTIKFALLGIGSTFGATIYLVSTILVFPREDAVLSVQSFRIFPTVFLLACGLIFKSWSRYTGRRSRIVVSQSLIYSTITLVSVGVYLIAAGLLARWARQWQLTGIPAEAVIFLLSLVVLLSVTTAATFRDRASRWIRQHLFAGKYDYRRFWMAASERIRSIDSPTASANALIEILESAFGSLDLSVWTRISNSDVMRLTAVRGKIVDRTLPLEISGVVENLEGVVEPKTVHELEMNSNESWPKGVLDQAKASLIVPLISSGGLVGLVTIGEDRTGRPFDWETREFLSVVAVHFASEFHKAELLSRRFESQQAEAFQTFSTFLLHDLKNFASTLSLVAKNASRHHSNPNFQLDAFQSVVEISGKMKRLCNSLRVFSSTLASHKDCYDVNDVLLAVTGTFEGNIGAQLQLDLSQIPAALIDRAEMIRVFQNLILNAHEASPPGSPIQVTSGLGPRGIVITVADRGKGIPREFPLFQPFHTTKADGLGIGLFQSRKIVEAHAGAIEIESKEGEGTVVRVLLPLPVNPTPVNPSSIEEGETDVAPAVSSSVV